MVRHAELIYMDNILLSVLNQIEKNNYKNEPSQMHKQDTAFVT